MGIRTVDPREITGAMCGWRGCSATFAFTDHPPGSLPPAWRHLFVLRDGLAPLLATAPPPDPQLPALTLLARAAVDVILCPPHAARLAGLLKALAPAPPGGPARARFRARARHLRAVIDQLKHDTQALENTLLLQGERPWHELDVFAILQSPRQPYEEWATHQMQLVEQDGAERYFALLAAHLEHHDERRTLTRRSRRRRRPPRPPSSKAPHDH